jgi:hypothetical protein
MRLVNGISQEAMELLQVDDDLNGDNTVYSLKALIPKDKSGELYPSRLLIGSYKFLVSRLVVAGVRLVRAGTLPRNVCGLATERADS